ncbi:uncharacterized protein LOC111397978 [Olea europaea var. sylvestris]|uniref:uncharacterized protein LOC111397978 n=1 Tax=Olea europaea var. sylvestris TaxID=158386 RepID=UPI000C1D20D4|nr:uncharacterized protein LOC111397978 [Olea europaea var. sylvestris]
MVRIDPRISCYRLNINASYAQHRQKRRALNPESYKAFKDEVNKLSRSGFIKEAIYSKWISNPVLMRKSSEKWTVCVDFTNLNKACPKDSFPLPRIDQLIPMFRPDEEATSFIIDKGLATDKSLSFFKVLKQGKKFQWTDECEKVLQALKKHLGEVPLLSKPKPQESLLLYLAVSDEAVSAVIVREEDEHQLPVYYVSKALLPTETRYPGMEKLALALITASRKLRLYIQAHSIEVLTNFPLKQVLQQMEASDRLLKLAIELSEFDQLFRPKHAIKGQTLADFVAKFAIAPEMETAMEPAKPPTWNLFVDGSSRETGSEAGIALESPEGHKLNCVRRLLASSDSQLVVSQVNGNFVAKDSSMVAYLKLVVDLIPHFERFKLIQVPRLENPHADALSKLASSKDSELLKIVPIERLSKPSIFGGEELLWIESTPVWMQHIIAYLKDQSLPALRNEARKLRRRAAHFVLQEDVLYKRGFASPLLRCVEGEEATYILREIHEGICENHSGGMALAHMVLRQGYFWPTLKRDACQFV